MAMAAVPAAELAKKSTDEFQKAIRAAGRFLMVAAEHPTFVRKRTVSRVTKAGKSVVEESGLSIPAWAAVLGGAALASFVSTNMGTLSGGRYSGYQRRGTLGSGSSTPSAPFTNPGSLFALPGSHTPSIFNPLGI